MLFKTYYNGCGCQNNNYHDKIINRGCSPNGLVGVTPGIVCGRDLKRRLAGVVTHEVGVTIAVWWRERRYTGNGAKKY